MNEFFCSKTSANYLDSNICNTSVVVGTRKKKEDLFPQKGNNFSRGEVGLPDPLRVCLHYLILIKYTLNQF